MGRDLSTRIGKDIFGWLTLDSCPIAPFRAFYQLGPKESTEEGKNKSESSICSKRSRTWKSGGLVAAPSAG